MKTCSKCGKEKDDSEFNKGYGSKCKACKNEYQKQYDIAHKEERMQYRKIYKKENKEKEKEWDRKYREKNADKVKERARKYREKNADKVRERGQKYYKDNHEKIMLSYYKNRETILEKKRGMNEQEWKEKKELDRMDIEMRRILAKEKELEKDRARAKERYIKKAEEIKSYHVRYRKENKEKIKEYNDKYMPMYRERTELINSAKGKLKRRGIDPEENKELLESIMLETRLKRVIKYIKSHKEVTNG